MTELIQNFLKLNRLILFLAVTASILTFVNSLYSSYEVQKEQLVLQALDVNQAYASKLSETTELFLASSLQQLSYSASRLADKMQDDDYLNGEVDRLRYQTNGFNSIAISDSNGVVKAISSEGTELLGQQVTSIAALNALKMKKTLISKPYLSTINNYLIFISTPIFDIEDNYLGFVGGAIYLKKPNILNKILGQHYYHNGSYIYVVNKEKQILYHPNINEIGHFIVNSNSINEMVFNQQGGIVLNRGHETILAGYASIPSTDWLVITHSSLESSLTPLAGIMQQVILRTIPMAIVGFIVIWLFAWAISRPLQLLAKSAKSLDNPDINGEIEVINSWYVESLSLKKAILSGRKSFNNQLGRLQREADTDPLTGAHNRRSFRAKLDTLAVSEVSFSILSLDIDYFKRINDTYGHSVGDSVLKHLTLLMNDFCRDDDMVARTGGEEFVLLLRGTTLNDAFLVAEQLRITTAEEIFEIVGHISVSIGVATWTTETSSIDEVLTSVDKALYEAKGQGRNRCIMATRDIIE